MKQFYAITFFVFTSCMLQAQIINIPDANLKSALVNSNCVINYLGNIDIAYILPFYYYAPINRTKVDTNGDGEIQVSEALAVENLTLANDDGSSFNISSLEGLQHFSNLNYLNCGNNVSLNLDVSLSAVTALECTGNNWPTINLSLFPNLIQLNCSNNGLSALNLSPFQNLRTLFCSNNQIQNLDLSDNNNLYNLSCSNNALETLNLKNGSYMINQPCILEPEDSSILHFNGNPNLLSICFDFNPESGDFCLLTEEEFILDRISSYGMTTVVTSTYCSFIPGGDVYEIQGESKFDANNNGCDVLDVTLPNLSIGITNGSVSSSIIASTSGNYYIPVGSGNHTLTPQLENPSYFNISPTSFTVDFPTDTSPFTQNFCVTANGINNDLEIILIPLEQAVPGFDTNYELLIKNKGNTTLSGDFNLIYNDDIMDFVFANPIADSQATGSLTWNYANLHPLETQSAILTMNMNTPTDSNFPVNAGDVLDFMATVTPVSGDEVPGDNAFNFSQIVVNAYDPNDKTCLQGATIAPDQVGDYVHYTIRFENLGTASAVNIVVKDVIDLAKYDISTLVPLAGSHDFVTRIQGNNRVEFIFENINLPEDDANNDGYITYKIKTQPSLVLGDTFTNKAEIYFDFNAPIITNEATTIVALLGVEDFSFLNTITIYPNPTVSELNVRGKNIIQNIQILDIKGSVLLNKNNIESKHVVLNVEDFESGLYFIKVYSNKSFQTFKFIKK